MRHSLIKYRVSQLMCMAVSKFSKIKVVVITPKSLASLLIKRLIGN